MASDLDKKLKDSFPASDAPANSEGDSKTPQKGVTDDRPTGRPISDRYETERGPLRD